MINFIYLLSILSNIQVILYIQLLVVLTLSNATGKQILCENKGVEKWAEDEFKTCWMITSTTIDSNDTTVEVDETIDLLSFAANKKIQFLPVEVAVSFPKLKVYGAVGCSIETIEKIHFKGLAMLRYLLLKDNYIKTIPSDSFEDLTSLEALVLGKNNGFPLAGSLKSSFFQPTIESSR